MNYNKLIEKINKRLEELNTESHYQYPDASCYVSDSMPLPVKHNGCDGSHCGLTDVYRDFRIVLEEVWNSGLDFETEWWGSKKEIASAQISRIGNKCYLQVSVSCDEEIDLIDDAIWSLARDKSKNDGSKYNNPDDYTKEYGITNYYAFCKWAMEQVEQIFYGDIILSDPSFENQATIACDSLTLDDMFKELEKVWDGATEQSEDNFDALKDSVQGYLEYLNSSDGEEIKTKINNIPRGLRCIISLNDISEVL